MSRRSSWTPNRAVVVAVIVSIALLPAKSFSHDLPAADDQVTSDSRLNQQGLLRGTYTATGAATDADDARTAINAVGLGKKIELTERDPKRRVRAEIRAIAPDHFTVKDGRVVRDVSYSNVARLKRAGISTPAKVGIITGAVVGAVLIAGIISIANNGIFGDRPLLGR